jgi:hypothetical protein
MKPRIRIWLGYVKLNEVRLGLMISEIRPRRIEWRFAKLRLASYVRSGKRG